MGPWCLLHAARRNAATVEGGATKRSGGEEGWELSDVPAHFRQGNEAAREVSEPGALSGARTDEAEVITTIISAELLGSPSYIVRPTTPLGNHCYKTCSNNKR